MTTLPRTHWYQVGYSNPLADQAAHAWSTTPYPGRAIAAVIRKGLKSPYKAASKLRSAFEMHGLDVPQLAVQQSKVALGTITVQTGDALALLLGAAPQSVATDLEDWDAGWRLADRLGAAVKKATGDDLLDIKFHAYCTRGCGSAALELGSLPAATARCLAATLRKSKARQPQRETTVAERHTA